MNSIHLTDAEVAAIAEVESTSNILTLVTKLTSLRFAAIAKVTEQRWIACAVRDEINFGVEPGGELPLEVTICNELRAHRTPVVISCASRDPIYASHPLPKHYGFESYFSIPIILADGTFFGTLCGNDPLPVKLDDPELLQTLVVFANLIATTLDMQNRLAAQRVAVV